MSEHILQEQIAYYRARAQEYDQWFYRQGRYDMGDANNQQWFAEVEAVKADLTVFNPSGEVLELASGTGIWTEQLLRYSQQITCVDASPEMIAIHKAKLESPHIDYLQDDLFQWRPAQQYDVVFFSFWLSHVPADKLVPFLKTVREALKPGGRVFMLDSQRTPLSTARNHVLPEQGDILERKLNDGRAFSIVKVFYSADKLQSAFNNAGLLVDVRLTETFFIYALGRRGEEQPGT